MIKNKAAIRKMAQAGKLLSQMFEDMRAHMREGKSTLEIDAWIATQLKKNNLRSKSKGYMGYQHVSCISVNDVVVHGVPSSNVVLKKGDLVTVDVCASWNGYCADMARSFIVGIDHNERNKKLIEVAQIALDKGIAQARAGNRLTDISAAVQHEVERYGFGVVRDFAGHGIGKQMHEDPEVLNYGKPGRGPVLRPGMALAIEPMITMGSYDVAIMEDGWTVKTRDRSWAAHVEDTIVITEGEPVILTRLNQKDKSPHGKTATE